MGLDRSVKITDIIYYSIQNIAQETLPILQISVMGLYGTYIFLIKLN